MGFKRWLERGIKAVLPPALFLALVAYFLFNATQGERGSQAYELRKQQFQQVAQELKDTQAVQKNWERKVAAMGSQRLDPDRLDEQVRAKLDYAEPGDVLITYGPGKKLF